MVTIEMAMTALNRPLPSTVTIVIANSNDGNASSTSMHRMITLSIHRP